MALFAATGADANIKAVITADDRASKVLDGFSAKTVAVGSAIGNALGNLAADGVRALVGEIGNAVKRVDTLENFPRVLTAMGATATDANSATQKLSKALQGLPTTLQDGAAGVQSLVAAGLSVPRATDAFLAMNDALLAAGAGADDTQIVMQSLVRAISAGSVDAATMQAALSRMPTVMQALSKETGKTAGELFNLYSSDPQKLIDDMIRLDKQGSGAMSSLAKQARDATGGIGSAWTNLQTAVTRGIANIIAALGSSNISSAITNFGTTLEGGLKSFGTTLADIVPKIQAVAVQIGDYLGPKLEALWNTVTIRLIPAISEFAKAFGPAAGAGLVGFIGLTIDGLNLLLKVAGPVLQFLSDHTWIVWGVVAAFAALKLVLFIDSAVQSFQAGMQAVGLAMQIASGEAVVTTGKIGTLRAVLALLIGPWQIMLAIAGVGIVLGALYEVEQAIKKVSKGIDDLNAKQVTVAGRNVSGGSDIGLTAQLRNAFAGFRAGGGPVTAGKAYIVGEQGPELMVPGSSGEIVPNNKLRQGAGATSGISGYGSLQPINITFSGIFTGNKQEFRKLAVEAFKSASDAAAMKGYDMANMTTDQWRRL